MVFSIHGTHIQLSVYNIIWVIYRNNNDVPHQDVRRGKNCHLRITISQHTTDLSTVMKANQKENNAKIDQL